jgi:hypothetical protein
MKERFLVMNGQKIVQHEVEGQWQNRSVEKAGVLKPGIYNLYLANQVDKTETNSGVILHGTNETIFQQVGKKYVKHNREDFDIMPGIGSNCSISYEKGRAVVSAASVKLSRGVSR